MRVCFARGVDKLQNNIQRRCPFSVLGLEHFVSLLGLGQTQHLKLSLALCLCL
jgi:hypothetical protein